MRKKAFDKKWVLDCFAEEKFHLLSILLGYWRSDSRRIIQDGNQSKSQIPGRSDRIDIIYTSRWLLHETETVAGKRSGSRIGACWGSAGPDLSKHRRHNFPDLPSVAFPFSSFFLVCIVCNSNRVGRCNWWRASIDFVRRDTTTWHSSTLQL